MQYLLAVSVASDFLPDYMSVNSLLKLGNSKIRQQTVQDLTGRSCYTICRARPSSRPISGAGLFVCLLSSKGPYNCVECRQHVRSEVKFCFPAS